MTQLEIEEILRERLPILLDSITGNRQETEPDSRLAAEIRTVSYAVNKYISTTQYFGINKHENII